MPELSLRDALAASLPDDLTGADLLTARMGRTARRSRGRHLAVVGVSSALVLGAVGAAALVGFSASGATGHLAPAAFDSVAAARSSAADRVAVAVGAALPGSTVDVGGRPKDGGNQDVVWLRVRTGGQVSSLALTIDGFTAADRAVDSANLNCDGQVGHPQVTTFIPNHPLPDGLPITDAAGIGLRPICTTSTAGDWTFFQVDNYDVDKATTSPGGFALSGSAADNLGIAATSPDAHLHSDRLVGVLATVGVQQAVKAYARTLG